MALKQVIVLRKELDISKGKMISQACHASLNAYKDASDDKAAKWEREGAKKVVLEEGEESLDALYRKAKRNKLPVYLVKDAGLTEVEPGTKTALGIGPAEESKIDAITGNLGLVK